MGETCLRSTVGSSSTAVARIALLAATLVAALTSIALVTVVDLVTLVNIARIALLAPVVSLVGVVGLALIAAAHLAVVALLWSGSLAVAASPPRILWTLGPASISARQTTTPTLPASTARWTESSASGCTRAARRADSWPTPERSSPRSG